MQKYVLKVSIISVLALFAVALLSYFFIAIFSPVTVANFYSNVANFKKASIYYESEYRKSGEIEDLCLLCDNALKSGDNELIAEHLQKLCEDETFYSYCQAKEDGVEYYELITSKYLQSEYLLGNIEDNEIISLALTYLKTYSNNCAVRSIMFVAVESEDKEFLTSVLTALNAIDTTNFTENEILLISTDIANLTTFLS